MKYAFIFHVLGLVFLFAGLLFGTKLLKISATETPSPSLMILAKKNVFAYIIPGVLLMVLSGLHQLYSGGISIYMKQGWMHAKLTLIVVLLWSSIMVAIRLISLSKGQGSDAKFATMHHAIAATLLVLILILTFAKPF